MSGRGARAATGGIDQPKVGWGGLSMFASGTAIAFLVIFNRPGNGMTLIGIRFAPRAGFAGLVVAIFLTGFAKVEGALINAASTSFADVSSAVASAVDGDTVVIPAGKASWTQTLNITKGITLRGANINATDDLTIILDNIVITNGAAPIVSAELSPTQSFRVSGITFRVGSRTTEPTNGAALRLTDSPTQTAPCTSMRIDHCHFDGLNQMGLRITGWFYGVIDHCQWDTATSGNIFSMTISAPTWGGGTQVLGNRSWADPSYWGSEKFVFVEDCTFNNNATAVTSGCWDADNGGRYVCRYNTFKNTWPGQHGTESGAYRGGRAFEIYNNTMDYPSVILSGNLRRSGTDLVYNNTITGLTNPHIMNLTAYREDGSSWLVGGASGTNSWDVNDTTDHTGNGFGGGPSGLYASGTASSGTDSTALTVSGTPWTANQWVGYMVTNLNQLDSRGFKVCSFVTSNTSNTMSFSFNGTGTQLKFKAGDAWQLRRVTVALDQPGRGQGDLCAFNSNGQFYNTTTGGATSPHELLEPVYCWNNKVNGTMNAAAATVNSTVPTVKENREFYNYAAPVGGAQTVGVGSGTLANRPTTCTPGVAYWATDQNTLYIATATNTWSVYYKPYVYPHPLVSGAPVPPSAPTNLHVVMP
jgi:hypothetical protein